jgi:steroid delta-isomerase-like uncharacterized protein
MLPAMLEENKNVARQWFEQVWNKKDESAIDRLFHVQGKCYGFPEADSVLIGPEAFKAVHRSFCGAFPDLKMEIDDLVAEGDRVAVRWHVTMTHTGDHLGLPASGKQVTLAGSSIIVTDGEQILDGWNFMDLGAMFAKLKTI